MAVASIGPLLDLGSGRAGLSIYFFARQDLWVAIILFLAWIRVRPDANFHPGQRILPSWAAKPSFVAIAALSLILICWLGRYWLYQDYDLSRDEQMANFDAYIFSHGRLFWPITSYWRPFADALNQTFILPIGNHEAWVSAYLPVNAAMRALFGQVANPALLNPMLAAGAFVALWRVTLRILPGSPNAQAVTLILFLCSSQILVTAMTSYAMTAHLAFNSVWLLLFLKDRPLTHVAAAVLGFLATGLHQPLFHPLFVLPFLALLVGQRRWPLLAFYCICYTAIALFWLLWPIWISSHATTYVAIQGDTATSYTGRLALAMKALSPTSIYLMVLNLLRFAAWQHLLLIPLAVTGSIFSWRSNALSRALCISFLLPIAAMLILLAYQGHGWGYRYVHGVLGNACLLAGLGWRHLEGFGIFPRKALAATTAITCFIVMPFQAWAVHRHVAAYADVDRKIQESGADIALIDDRAAPFAQDLVLNRPDLENRPIRLAAEGFNTPFLAAICRKHTIAVFEFRELVLIRSAFGSDQPQQAPKQTLTNRVRSAGCQ